jgi:hypothetical protein
VKQAMSRSRSFKARLCVAIAAASLFGLLLAAPAWAGFSQVGTFARPPQGGVTLAVNSTGAGGVPAGSLYVGDYRYDAQGESPTLWPSSGSVGSSMAINQATGYIYAATTNGHVNVFNPSGQLVTSFGSPEVEFGEKVEDGPEHFHEQFQGRIAVDSSGVVYITDSRENTLEAAQHFETRIMIFEPATAGDYEHYVYAGRSHDIIGPTENGRAFRQIAVDDAGHVYVTEESRILEYGPGSNTPICETPGSLPVKGMTVDAQTGEVFYFNVNKRAIIQLNACNAQGEFTPKAELALVPKPASIEPLEFLAFDPLVAYSSTRPAGILYGSRGTNAITGYILAPAEEAAPPTVASEAITAVTASSASASAQINPNSTETRYAFQYITQAAYEANGPSEPFSGATEVPAGGGLLGTGNQLLGASAALTGLLPDTQYHFRVVASSHCNAAEPEELCEAAGEDKMFHTYPLEAPGLPDGRAYELVSPALKSGGEVFPMNPGLGRCFFCKPGWAGASYPRQSAVDGESVVYEGFPFSFTEGAVSANEYLSRRTPSGWETVTLAPKLLEGSVPAGYRGFDASLTKGVLFQEGGPSLSPLNPGEFNNLYVQPTAEPGALSPLVLSEPPTAPPAGFKTYFAGASYDFSRLFFAANDALTGPTAVAPAAPGVEFREANLYESRGGELRLVNVLPGNGAAAPDASFGAPAVNQTGVPENNVWDLSHAISDDGSVAFWSDASDQVYARIDGETTVEIPDPAKFLSASADGSEVLLRDGHIYNLETEQITDLTAGLGGFLGIAGQSEDLSSVYFVDTGVLTGEEENEFSAKAVSGKPNLYAWRAGVTTYIGTLESTDSVDWAFAPVQRSAQASANGAWLAFQSFAPLTGIDNTGTCLLVAGKWEKGACSQAFLYDATAKKLICASCRPTEESPLGRSHLPNVENQSAEAPLAQPRYLTDEGRLYFDSQDSLSPFDTNNGIEDVYQYEPNGSGACRREAGCVNLISAGREPVDSNFLAMDESGKNVFFTTRDQLVRADSDGLIDLYDAREGGGIPSQSEIARGECQGEACQPPVSPPSDPTPASSSFQGAGNVVEKTQAKKKQHKVKKHKAKKRHKKQDKKHANRKTRGAK